MSMSRLRSFAMRLSMLIDSPGEKLTGDFVNTGSFAPMRFTKPYFVRNCSTSAVVLRGWSVRLARSRVEKYFPCVIVAQRLSAKDDCMPNRAHAFVGNQVNAV